MKKTCLWLCPAMVMAGMMLFGGTTPVLAEERGRPDERMERLEHRFNEFIERQKNAGHHDGPLAQRLEHHLPPRPEAGHPPLPPAPPAKVSRCPLAGMCGPCPALLIGLLALCSIINILIAVWIYSDIRKRGEGSGIFIALALVAGIPTAIIYALVRIGDKK